MNVAKTLVIAFIYSTLNLIPATAAELADYYKAGEGKSARTLLSALKTVVGPHTSVGYDGLWEVYRTSDVYPDGTIWDMYSTKHWSAGQKCGNYKNVGDCYNREHSFPKSWFSKASPMMSDAFHIYPTDGKVNGQRSNYPYGECSGGTSVASNGGIKALGRLGTSTFPGYSGKVFEPDDEYKGDFARSYFYMAAAYNDKIANWKSDMLAGNDYPAYKQWAIDLMLKWHRQDPVSQKEKDRNEAVYAFQHNRNPFIDHPELAEHIWGNKTSEPWYASGSATPELNRPTSGSAINFGLTTINRPVARTISIKGSNLKSALSISSSSSDFTLSTNTILAATANSDNATLTITYRSAVAKTSDAVLTITSSDGIHVTVNLTATTVAGIPALEATEIDETSFTANWISLGEAEHYTLDVRCDGTSIAGYPRQVSADAEECPVRDLTPATTYTYLLWSDIYTSNTVDVTTSTPIPSAVILTDGDIQISTQPDTPSDPIQLFIDIENIDSQLTISVDEPFALSTNHLDWSTNITIDPLEDHFYLRLNATKAGEYETSVNIQADDYINDNLQAYAFVADNTTPWFIETFETAGSGKYDSYNTTSIVGSACTWTINDAGIWKNDSPHTGTYALRLGKTSSSSLMTTTPKHGGIGTISFFADRWSASDGDVHLSVEYSPDGSEWHTAADIVADTDTYKQFTIPVNVQGDNYIRLRQTAGQRGHIDDITVTDYTAAIDYVEADPAASWDAFAANGNLIIENHDSAADFIVINLQGIIMHELRIGAIPRSLAVEPGIYIVNNLLNNTTRRVLVK